MINATKKCREHDGEYKWIPSENLKVKLKVKFKGAIERKLRKTFNGFEVNMR